MWYLCTEQSKFCDKLLLHDTICLHDNQDQLNHSRMFIDHLGMVCTFESLSKMWLSEKTWTKCQKWKIEFFNHEIKQFESRNLDKMACFQLRKEWKVVQVELSRHSHPLLFEAAVAADLGLASPLCSSFLPSFCPSAGSATLPGRSRIPCDPRGACQIWHL